MTVRSVTAIGAGIALAMLPLLASGEDSTHRCAQVQDDGQRLACYDAAYGRPAAHSPASTVAKPVKARSADPATAALAGTVSAVAQLRDGRMTYTLADGQRWTQVEADARVEVAVGNPVTVRRAMLGSYLLVTPSGATTRVRQGN
jgi:hypothetical protein